MKVHLIRDDITHMEVDAIMNPTNSDLYGFSGIDGLVHEAGGPELEEQCQRLKPISIGEAVVTLAFGLPCKKIVHVAVPRWRGGYSGEKLLLKAAYIEGLRAAFKEPDIHSLAIPLMGSGGYKFPMSVAFNIAQDSLKEFEEEVKRKRKGFTVFLVMYSVESMMQLRKLMISILENIDDEYAESHPNRNTYSIEQSQNIDRMFQKIVASKQTKPNHTNETLDEYIDRRKGSFQATLFAFIQKSGKTDSEVYTSAGITKSHFSKLKNPQYNVQKDTVLRLAVALKLDIDEMGDLLESAGFTIDRSKIKDLVYEYYISKEKWDLNKILYEIDERLAD